MTLSSYGQFGSWGGGGQQSKIKGKITGELVDSLSSQSVGFATIVLMKAGKTKEVNGVLSEDNGKFKLAEVKMGKYDAHISFLGYNDKIIKDIELTGKDPDYNCGRILLSPADYVLDEVEVTAKRALFENKVDKLVFNAEDDSSISGGDATDVLRKVPTLSVDLEGNVSLRGSQNVRILINGKPSGMFSSNVADALKMFPADQIKKVEVITSPGAKYDGEGSAGIINIITKKENIEGIAGSVSGSVGNRQNNGNLSLNAGKGRFGFSSSGGFYYSNPADADLCVMRGTNNFSYDEALACQSQSGLTYSNSGITNSSRLGFNASASAFYDFNAYNALNSSFNLRGFSFDTDGESTGSFPSIVGMNSAFSRNNTTNTLNSGYDWNTDFTKKFEASDKQELVFAIQVSSNVMDQDNFVNDLGFITRNEEIQNNGDNLELTGQVDYVQPIGKSNKLEVGIKSVIRDIKSDSEFRPKLEGQADFTVDDSRSFLFNYDQNVYSAYVSYNFFIKKFNLVTGLRFERTEIDGSGALRDGSIDTETQAVLAGFPFSYDNWLPNFAISRSLKNFRTIKLSYSKRIQRPSLYYINPFRNTTDFANLVIGNPQLSPELTDQVELSYNTSILGFTVFSSLYYKYNTDIIEQISTTDSNSVLRTSFGNVGTNNSIGTNLFITRTLGVFTIRGGGDIYTYNASGTINGKEFDNQALSYRLFTGGEYAFSGTFKADFFGFFQAPRFTLQGENASFSIMGIGFKKEFKNYSLGIRIIEPFAANKNFDSDITGADFRQVTQFSIPFRSIGVNFSYKFGKVDFKERKSKIKNADQKAGEGEGQGGGGGQGGGMSRG